MKRLLCLFAAFCLAVGLTACGSTAESDLLDTGREMVAVMKEMLGSEAYAAMLGATTLGDLQEQVDTHDYDSPVAVYRIDPPDAETLLTYVGGTDATEHWGDLSDTLKEQLKNRLSFSNIISVLNGRAGSKQVAFASLYLATKQDASLKVERSVVYLFTFEEGTPIAVTFNEGSVSGQFLFLEAEEIPAALEAFNCNVSKIS